MRKGVYAVGVFQLLGNAEVAHQEMRNPTQLRQRVYRPEPPPWPPDISIFSSGTGDDGQSAHAAPRSTLQAPS